MKNDKLGTYITKLMTTILEKDQEEFVKQLALSELQRLNVNITEFLSKFNEDKQKENKQEKQLLQEEIKDGEQSSTGQI